MSNQIFTMHEAVLGFGGRNILDGISLAIYPEDRICLVGRNGEGKSTLCKAITGELSLDAGKRWILPGIRFGYLPQNFADDFAGSIGDFLLRACSRDGEEDVEYKINKVAIPLGIDLEKMTNELSGGQARRVYLASALLNEPDLLILDEPTNHLDIETIKWLEDYIAGYQGAVICISHDRTFLKKISRKTFWLEQGGLLTSNRGYEGFEDWSISIYEQREREFAKLQKKLDQEEVWRNQGVTARRKRNQRRLAELYELRNAMRQQKAMLKKQGASISHQLDDPFGAKSKLVLELQNVNYKELINDFSITIVRGDKIGLIGPNGCGKSTLLKMMIKELEPDSGKIKIAKHLNITYYDQMRADIDMEDTLWEALAGDSDYVKVGGKEMHVVAYLKQFMFDPKQAKEKVITLSGGQLGRLMLAKVLANPGSLLILDEPTNDLDIDTLDMIQEILDQYTGTLIVVSHDRDFLDRIVAKTLIFENKKIVEFYGSYNEYVADVPKKVVKEEKHKYKEAQSVSSKLSYKVKYELENLPRRIEECEGKISEISGLIADPNFYNNSPVEFQLAAEELKSVREKHEELWRRWLELDKMLEELE